MKEYCTHALHELHGVVEERCARAEEKHWEAPISVIHFKEEAVEDQEDARAPAVDVLSYLMSAHRASYRYVIEALQCRFGHLQQVEVHRSRLKVWVRGQGERLMQLAQEMESLVYQAYPMAQEDMVNLLTRDCFVDALQDSRLQIYVKQAHPKDVKEALTRASEMVTFLKTTIDLQSWFHPVIHRSRDYQDPKGVVEARNATGLSSKAKHQLEAVLPHQELLLVDSTTYSCACGGHGEWALHSARGGHGL
ncbi:hypothetical protein E2C01_000456 [Portunus trituberculatus]|uniref:Uncharacterized protein n=1 Tax=Portunus trituberculatus TaxID=210409 RepID=A0A5B7CFB1_PORTR|nr:hypothetical protein [Portunus trituberculatus]